MDDAFYLQPLPEIRPFGGLSPPSALFYASRDRRQEHPERHLKTFSGILQADAYGGYNPLFKVDRDPVPLRQALCWAHSRPPPAPSISR